ncbi:unnamed protein product [Effrenium voratum]|nr:unnamed protein product [Effrenium voratum]
MASGKLLDCLVLSGVRSTPKCPRCNEQEAAPERLNLWLAQIREVLNPAVRVADSSHVQRPRSSVSSLHAAPQRTRHQSIRIARDAMQRALLRLPRRRRFWSLAVCAAWPDALICSQASSWVPSLAPRVLSRCVAAKAEASDGEVPSAEVVLQQLEESGLFEGQEEMLLRLRMLAAQGVHPLDALRASRLQEDRRGQEEPRDAVLESFDIEGVAKYMQASKCKNVVVMCGAGISTSAGIPDFRTPGSGLYEDNLQRYNLSQPELMFDLAFFRSQPAPFYELCKELWPGTYRPTRAHYFIRLLEEKGVLRRCYTQKTLWSGKLVSARRRKLWRRMGTWMKPMSSTLCRRERLTLRMSGERSSLGKKAGRPCGRPTEVW